MVKVISLSNDAYDRLKRRKTHGKSFSEVVVELTDEKKRGSIMDLFGALKDDPDSISAFEEAYRDRRRLKLRDVKF